MAVKRNAQPIKREYKDIPAKIEKVTEELSCNLNEVEWQNRARESAEALQEVEDKENRKKTVMSELNADVKTAKIKASKLAGVVTSRRELRTVTVEVKYDYEAGVIIRTRTDTGEEISRREMTTSERQSSLFEEEAVDANDLIESRHEEDDDELKTTNKEEA